MIDDLDKADQQGFRDAPINNIENSPPENKKERSVKTGTKFDTALLDALPISLTATLGRGAMTVASLAALSDDTIVTLDTPLNGQVDLLLNGHVVARGEIVAVDNHFGVKIAQVFTRKD
jgi:flagellar motor switch protein FliN